MREEVGADGRRAKRQQSKIYDLMRAEISVEERSRILLCGELLLPHASVQNVPLLWLPVPSCTAKFQLAPQDGIFKTIQETSCIVLL